MPTKRARAQLPIVAPPPAPAAVPPSVKRPRAESLAYQKRVRERKEAEAKAELADAAAQQAILDEQLLRAKHSLKAKRRLSGGEVYGDLSAAVREFQVDRHQLRTAMNQPGDQLRPKRGRPFTLHPAVEEVIKEEVETRASKNRALSFSDVAVQMAGCAAAGGEAYAEVLPSDTCVRHFLHRRGLLVRKANVTDKARILCSKDEVHKYFEKLKQLRTREPLLQDRRRNGNMDETPGGSTRGEKFFERQMFAITSRSVIQKQRGKQTRIAAIDDGGNVISYVPFLLGDGTLLCEIYVVSGKTVLPDWTRLPSKKLPPEVACEFLPGIDLEVFKRGNVAIYTSDSGAMNQDLLKEIFERTIIPCWRALPGLQEGPLLCRMDAPKSHRVNAAFAQLLLDNQIHLLLLPHNSSTLLQPLDNGFNKWWRKNFKRIVANLISVSQNRAFILDDSLNVKPTGISARTQTQK
jgi:hypothetical protein